MLAFQASFKKLLLKGGGVKFISRAYRGECEKQGGKLLSLLSQLCPRIRPLDSSKLTCSNLIAATRPSELFMPLFRGCEHTERVYLPLSAGGSG